MKQIDNYLLPRLTEDLFTNEAKSSIALSKEVANKINELVDSYNELIKTRYDKMNEQDGRIRQGILYMKDNLANTINELLKIMKDNGELNDIIGNTLEEYSKEIESLKYMQIYYDENVISTTKYRDSEVDSDYYITIVKRQDHKGNKLKLQFGLALDNESLGYLESTVDFAHRKNASLCINGGIYNTTTNKPLGICIKDGKVLQNETLTLSKFSYLGIDSSGNLKSFDYRTSSNELLKAGIQNAVCCFTTLIKNGINTVLEDTTNYDPRNAIGQLANGDYIIITVDGRTRENTGFRYTDLQRIFRNYGATFAIALDGGGSTSTVVRGMKVNDDIDSSFNDRKIPNFLYIAKENNIEPSMNPFNQIGYLKQRLSKITNTLLNFDKGYIRLRAPLGQHYPGIEIYSNGNTVRDGKLGFTSATPTSRRIVFSMNFDGIEKNVFGCDEKGIQDINGYLGRFNRKPIVISNCNTISSTGIYRTTNTTLNKPYEADIGYILHVSMYDEFDNKNGNARQIFFSKDKDWIFTRTINEDGSFNDWRPLANYKGATSDRPTGTTGLMFFDTTLNKPIWYNGNKWVDSTGTAV